MMRLKEKYSPDMVEYKEKSKDISKKMWILIAELFIHKLDIV